MSCGNKDCGEFDTTKTGNCSQYHPDVDIEDTCSRYKDEVAKDMWQPEWPKDCDNCKYTEEDKERQPCYQCSRNGEE